MTHLKIKMLIIELKKFVLLGQYKLHMKPTTSLQSMIQQCQCTKFLFIMYYFNQKEKYHNRIINSKKIYIFIHKISIIIILIYQKVGLVGLVQQKTKLPSPKLY